MKESKDGDGMTNGGGGGSVFDIAMEEMTHEEVGEDEEKKEGDQESPSSLKTKGAVKEVEVGEKRHRGVFNTYFEPHRAPGANFA